MFQHIVVPLDGSARAEAAVPVAARIARAAGGTITLVNVLSSSEFLPYIFAALEPATLSIDSENASAYLQAVAQLPQLGDIAVRTEVHTGPAATLILERAHALAADLLVLTSHGRSGLVRWALGSVSSKLARQADIPVLVLRGEDEAPPQLPEPTAGNPVRALVALDGSPAAESAVAAARALVAALAGNGPRALHLLHVVPPSAVGERSTTTPETASETAETATKTASETAADYLRGVADGLKGETALTVTSSVVQGDDVAEAIIQAATMGEEVVDVIVLSATGQGGTGTHTLGAVAERVLNESTLPLLVARADKR